LVRAEANLFIPRILDELEMSALQIIGTGENNEKFDLLAGSGFDPA
jgi:hypothetical protein